MPRATDVSVKGATLYYLPVETRVPLKFGPETLLSVTCARVELTVADGAGRTAAGWGETPLSVQWVWPSALSYGERHEALKEFTELLAKRWAEYPGSGHPMELGRDFQQEVLAPELATFNEARGDSEPMPWLAALVCCSLFDLALHDAYGVLHGVEIYSTYNGDFMNRDLSDFLVDADGSTAVFEGKYPADYLVDERPSSLPAWHLVGGKDLLDAAALDGSEPDDGYPVLLADWIERDGLSCLKVKLRGDDAAWDYERLVSVGRLALEGNCPWLTTDFNCTVKDPQYVNAILDRLAAEHEKIFGMILYVEQPFPYDLEKYSIDVHSVSERKPLFMDESAHDWELVARGRELGWTGVALKTCKTQTGALLSLCWAKQHGMDLMVQDLTNPMLAQVPHVLLAAHAGTIMGVETNAMQFYPEASLAEAAVHPGLYARRGGEVELSTIEGPGFGYGVERIARELPEPVARYG